MIKRLCFCLLALFILPTASCTSTKTPTVKPTGLFVDIVSVSPSGSNAATVHVKTSPGAECTIQIQPPTGAVTSPLLKKKAGASGDVSWTWALATTGRGGVYNFTATAALNGEKVTAYGSFNLG